MGRGKQFNPLFTQRANIRLKQKENIICWNTYDFQQTVSAQSVQTNEFASQTPKVNGLEFGLNTWAMTHRRFRIVHFYPFILNAAAALLIVFFLHIIVIMYCVSHSDSFQTYLGSDPARVIERERDRDEAI